ncbi:MAG: NAD(P)-dependent oxidoreductase [Bacteroidales bacterium]|jgi:nucleoside-diphosphate-sugar epimerase|nr:NAD(P)-dependent oxidoreductase [Bacteroidales bacterium]HBL73468.1 NAD-dependent dehydratase [Bacteroidales bacterium]
MPSPPDSSKPTILITGAGGFVGGHLVERALEKGWVVWAGTRQDRMPSSSPNLHLINLDYEHPVHLREQIAQTPRWQYVIHCAGITRSVDAKAFSLINTTYTLNLANALMSTGKTPDKFLFMSSLEALGPGDEDGLNPITSDKTPHPVSTYGHSKLAAEEGLKVIEGLPWLILRPTGIYGPGDRDYLTMAALVKRGLAPTIGYRPQQLSFLYIDDLIDLCWLAAASPVSHKTWLVAHPAIINNRAFITLLQELLNKRHVLTIRVPLWLAKGIAVMGEALSRCSGKPVLLNKDKVRIMAARNWSCTVDALQADLGYTPPTDLQTGWTKTLSWYYQKGWM